jgi:hypothetical protein
VFGPVAELPPEQGQRAQDRLLNGQRRPHEADLVLELAQNERQSQGVPRDPCPRGQSIAGEAGQGLEGDLGSESGPELNQDVHRAVACVPGRMRNAGRDDDRVARTVAAFDTRDAQAQLAR